MSTANNFKKPRVNAFLNQGVRTRVARSTMRDKACCGRRYCIHEDLAGVIDGVGAVGLGCNDDTDAEPGGHGLDAGLGCGGDADEIRVEVGHVLGELGRRVAFGIHRHEDDMRAHRGRGALQALLHGREQGQRSRAKVGTIRIAEKQHGPGALQVGGSKCPTVGIDEAKIRQRALRRQISAGEQGDRGRLTAPQERAADTRKAGHTDDEYADDFRLR